MWLVEPSGVSYRYYGVAYGKGKQAAKTELERLADPRGNGKVGVDEGMKEMIKVFLGGRDESKDKEMEIEMIVISEESGRMAKPVGKQVVEEVTGEVKKKMEEDEDEEEGEDEDGGGGAMEQS